MKGQDVRELAERLEAALREAGLEPEVSEAKEQIVIAARRARNDGELRVIAHLSTSETLPFAAGRLARDRALAHATAIAVRPSLASRAHAVEPSGARTSKPMIRD